MINKNRFIKFIFSILIFAIVLAGIHYLVYNALPEKYRPQDIIEMHIFLILLTVMMHTLLTILLRKKREYMGYGFIGASLLKIIICVLFLLPEILDKNSTTHSYVFQFFGLYFAYLIFEVLILVNELKYDQMKNKTN